MKLGEPAARLGRSRSPWPASASSSAASLVEDKLTLQTDPVQWVNQDSPGHQGHPRRSRSGTGRLSELGVFVQGNDVFTDGSVDYVDDFTPSSCATVPRQAAHGDRASWTTIGDLVNDVPGQPTTSTPTGADMKPRPTTSPRPTSAVDASAPSSTALNIIFRTGPGIPTARAYRSSARPPRKSEGRRWPTRQHGITATPSGLAVVGVGLLENLEANRIAAHLPGDRFRGPLPRRAAAQRRAVAAVAGAGAHRGRRRVARRLRPRPQAQPDDRGRRSAGGRRVHRVHVADPAALRRGARPGPRARGRRSTWPPRAPAARSSCRASPPSPASPCYRHLVAAAAARLRHRRRHERGRRPAQRAGRAAADAGVGRRRRNWVSRHLVPDDVLDGGGSGAAATPAHEPEPVAAT